LWRQSSEIHHAFYGNDIIGWSVFPVDAECHAKICHSKENWITDKDNPVWGNRNTEEFIKKLRDNYKFLRCGVEK
jgi:alkyl sulfatase BDS1-like metallo-beta-lactamase superfamily hydrolase